MADMFDEDAPTYADSGSLTPSLVEAQADQLAALASLQGMAPFTPMGSPTAAGLPERADLSEELLKASADARSDAFSASATYACAAPMHTDETTDVPVEFDAPQVPTALSRATFDNEVLRARENQVPDVFAIRAHDSAKVGPLDSQSAVVVDRGTVPPLRPLTYSVLAKADHDDVGDAAPRTRRSRWLAAGATLVAIAAGILVVSVAGRDSSDGHARMNTEVRARSAPISGTAGVARSSTLENERVLRNKAKAAAKSSVQKTARR